LETYFKAPFPTKRLDWLRFPKTNRLLELDGYNEKKRVAFEYQGRQHYELCYLNRYSEEKLKDIQTRDLFKEKICQQQGVNLIVVPYWIPKNNWKDLFTLP
jgi:hypothetical protein